MNARILILLPLCLFAPSCDKARALVDKAKESATASVAPSDKLPTGPTVRDLEAAEFESFIASPGRLMVVDFHADWCGPCRTLAPVMERVAGEFPGKVFIGKINVDRAGDLPGKEGVSGIPDVRLYRDGKLVDKFVGAISSDQVRELFAKHSAGITVGAGAAAEAGAPPAAAQPIQPMKKDWLPPGMERR
jgi:thioredoxin